MACGDMSMGWIGFFITLIVIGGAILLLIYLFKSKSSIFTSKSTLVNDRSMDILKERYARGEISNEDYDHQKKLLSS